MTTSTFSRLADIEAEESIKADEARNDAEILRRAMHIHPTVAEFISTLLDDLRSLKTAP